MQLFRETPVEDWSNSPGETLHSMRIRTLAAISIGLLSAACQGSYSQNTPSAAPPVYGNTSLSASAACADYGFRRGTPSFEQCVSRERQARAAGRMNRDYAAAQLTADARAACSSYGLIVATATYDRCVSREVDARSWRAEAAAPATTYATDQNGYRVDAQGYRVDAAYGHRIAAQAPYTQAGPQAYAGQSVPPYRMASTTTGSMPRAIASTAPAGACPSKVRTIVGSSGLFLFEPNGLARRIRLPLRRAAQSHRCHGSHRRRSGESILERSDHAAGNDTATHVPSPAGGGRVESRPLS